MQHPQPTTLHSSEPAARSVLMVVVLVNVVVLGWILYFVANYPERSERVPWALNDPAHVDAQEQQRLMAIGEQRYQLLCASCHGQDGRGDTDQGPPLAGSRWVNERPEMLARIVLHGMRQTDRGYRQPMQGWGNLPDREVAAILTYLRGSWGNEAAPVSEHTVTEVRAQTHFRIRPWGEQELEELLGVAAPNGEDEEQVD